MKRLREKLFGGAKRRATLEPAYAAIVAHGRDPGWYRHGGVPDTTDGRFDMLAAILALVLIRLEAEGERHAEASVLLTELFIDDMDGQLRQSGFGDVVVGKRVGKLIGALGGRIGAYREAFSGNDTLRDAMARNLHRGVEPEAEAIDYAEKRLQAFHDALAAQDAERCLAGELPPLA